MRKFFRGLSEHFIPTHGNTFRPYLLRKSWLIFFITILLTTEGIFAATFMAREVQRVEQTAAVVPADVIVFTNLERAKETEGLLIENSLLDAAAQAKANDMAQKGYFAHVSPSGKEPWAWIREASYEYRYAGENLAVRFDDSINVVNAWMASPTHRANIVKGVYTEIGIGVAQGSYEGSPATFVVQYFGTPLARSLPTRATQGSAVSVAPANTNLEPQVAGAQTYASAPVPTSTISNAESPQVQTHAPQSDSIFRQAAEALTDSSQSTSWVLGSVLLFVLFLLGLAFFIHIEIQSHEMLIGGALVAGVAALFLALNMHVSQPVVAPSQAAALGVITPTVLVGDEALSTQLEEAPQTQPNAPSE